MRTRTPAAILFLVVALIFAAPGGSWAAYGEPGPGEPGGGGSGGGGTPGGGGDGAPDFGDLVALWRDADGIPILSPSEDVVDPENGQTVVGGSCLQPIAAPGVRFDVNGDGEEEPCTLAGDTDSCLIPVDPLTCGVMVGYEIYLQPVDFGRMNSARAPDSVLDRALADLLVTLSTAQCIALDPPGRPVAFTPDAEDSDDDGDTTELITKTIDSPLQNLAIYREMISVGSLGDPPIGLPTPFEGYGILDTAAKALGAAADKGGRIGVEEIVYLNMIQGLSDKDTPTVLPKKCITYRDEVQGVVQPVEECFLLYRTGPETTNPPYGYQRSRMYGEALPFPPYVPAAPLTPQPGWFEYLAPVPDTYPQLFWIVQEPILDAVFENSPGFTAGNIGGFAQAADDARAVIDFMHTYPVLVGYGAPVLCEGMLPPPEDPYFYDVELSQLQVPRIWVGGSERESTVTVTNNGPDAASGAVQLRGTDTEGAELSASFTFLNLAAGASQSWTAVLTGPDYATTIQWVATVSAPVDTNSTNNTLTATTKVKKPRGKGTGEGEE